MQLNAFTVVVPVRDDVLVGRCLRSIDYAGATPLVVLNDASQSVRRIVEESGSRVLNLADRGAPAASEAGIWGADTEHVLLMDSDCVFRRGSLELFARAMDRASLIRGHVTFAHRSNPQRVVAGVRTLHTNAPSFVFKVPLMVDRRVAHRIGGYFFDSRLSWTEDFDLSIRVRNADLNVLRLPEAAVVHEPLSPGRDLRRAISYGKGHREGVRLGIAGYHELRPGGLQEVAKLAKRTGPSMAIYAYLFNFATAVGYGAELLHERMSNDFER